MTWTELLRQRLLLAHEYTIEDLMMACPSDYFGKNAPDVTDSSRCIAVIKRDYGQCRQCWNSEVPSEVLAAHGIDELDRLRAVAEAAEKLYALHDGDLEVDDLQKSQEHIDAEEALFDLLDVYHAAKEEEKSGK